MEIPVIASRELAHRLAALEPDDWVRLDGQLKIYQWKTGDGVEHSRMVLLVKEVRAA
jgi:hypothetical protein